MTAARRLVAAANDRFLETRKGFPWDQEFECTWAHLDRRPCLSAVSIRRPRVQITRTSPVWLLRVLTTLIEATLICGRSGCCTPGA
jgi:hypothetical protein